MCKKQKKTSFCKKLGHNDAICFVRLVTLQEVMWKHNIVMPKSPSLGKGQAFSTRALFSTNDNFILDYGTSHHMTHVMDLLESLFDINAPHITFRNSSHNMILGIGLGLECRIVVLMMFFLFQIFHIIFFKFIIFVIMVMTYLLSSFPMM